MKAIQNRIRRVCGQMASLETSIGSGNACAEVIPQLLAVKGSVDALVRVYLEASLDGCVKDKNTDSMHRLIKLLISKT